MYFGYAPVAHANEVIMVFPQVATGWQEATDRKGFHNMFFQKIFDRLGANVDSAHNYDLSEADQLIVAQTDYAMRDINQK